MLTTTNNNIVGEIIGWILIVGTLLSYLPQYYRMQKRKNTEGISEYMLISGSISSITNLIGTIQINLDKIKVCPHATDVKDNCYNVLMPLIQLFTPGICIFVFYLYFIYYTKYSNRVMFIDQKKDIYFNFGAFCLIIGILIVFIICQDTIEIVKEALSIQITGNVLNVISAIFSLLMWIPQIRKTKNLKKNGSLSILTLSIHGAGCGLTIIYQFIFNSHNIWVVLCYIIAFICEFTIVFMCIYYNKIKSTIKYNTSYNLKNKSTIKINYENNLRKNLLENEKL